MAPSYGPGTAQVWPAMAQDPPSLIQADPDKKFEARLLVSLCVAFFRVMSRHFTSLRFFSLIFAIFCDFDGFWLQKRRVLEVDFRRNFDLYAKTSIL